MTGGYMYTNDQHRSYMGWTRDQPAASTFIRNQNAGRALVNDSNHACTEY